MSVGLLPTASAADVRAHLRLLVRGSRLRLAGALVAIVLDSALTLAAPIAIGWLTQAIANGHAAGAVVGPVALLVVAALLSGPTAWLAQVLLARAVVPPLATLREETVAVAAELPLEMIEAGGTGDLVSRVSSDVELVTEAATEALASFLTSAFAILAALVGMLTLDWRLALAGLLALPIQALTLGSYLRTSGPIYAAGRIADGRRAATLLTGFTSLPTLRTFGWEGRQRDRIEEASRASIELEYLATRAATRFYGRLNVAELVGLTAILVTAFVLVRDDALTIGAATTAALFFIGLFDPINTVLGVFDSIQEAAAGLGRLVGIADLRRSLPTGGQTEVGGADGVELVASGVGFEYAPGEPALVDVSTVVAPGRHLAIVGASGSGKSTFATLLGAVRPATTGEVRLGGRPIEEIALPQRLAPLITQETHVFVGTLAENLLLGQPDAEAGELVDALAAVGAAEWVERLPEGVETGVGHGGHALTPAQAQQVALARVHLMAPAVVLLDEASAEAGSAAAGVLDRAAAAVVAGRSAVVVAHRLSQVTDADEILLLDRGRVIERGTHEELLALGGRYSELWLAWSTSR